MSVPIEQRVVSCSPGTRPAIKTLVDQDACFRMLPPRLQERIQKDVDANVCRVLEVYRVKGNNHGTSTEANAATTSNNINRDTRSNTRSDSKTSIYGYFINCEPQHSPEPTNLPVYKVDLQAFNGIAETLIRAGASGDGLFILDFADPAHLSSYIWEHRRSLRPRHDSGENGKGTGGLSIHLSIRQLLVTARNLNNPLDETRLWSSAIQWVVWSEIAVKRVILSLDGPSVEDGSNTPLRPWTDFDGLKEMAQVLSSKLGEIEVCYRVPWLEDVEPVDMGMEDGKRVEFDVGAWIRESIERAIGGLPPWPLSQRVWGYMPEWIGLTTLGVEDANGDGERFVVVKQG